MQIQAMKSVDRGVFCPNNPYEDSPQRLSHNVISTPSPEPQTLNPEFGTLSPKPLSLNRKS